MVINGRIRFFINDNLRSDRMQDSVHKTKYNYYCNYDLFWIYSASDIPIFSVERMIAVMEKAKWKSITILLPENTVGGYVGYVTAEKTGLGFNFSRIDMQNGEDVFNLTGVDLEMYGIKPEAN